MKKKKLDIIYEDKYIIVINKEAGLLSVSNLKEKEKTLYHEVSLYVKKKYPKNKIFIVHRLDKDTSGLVLFAKEEKIKYLLQDNWEHIKRGYLGIVKGNIKPSKAILKSYLKETKTHLVYSSSKGKEAITKYEKVAYHNHYSLLKIDIATGRHHQIRVQLKDINYPLVGDKIYHNENNRQAKRLYLHAYYLEFKHPITKELIILKTKVPKEFQELLKKDISI